MFPLCLELRCAPVMTFPWVGSTPGHLDASGFLPCARVWLCQVSVLQAVFQPDLLLHVTGSGVSFLRVCDAKSSTHPQILACLVYPAAFPLVVVCSPQLFCDQKQVTVSHYGESYLMPLKEDLCQPVFTTLLQSYQSPKYHLFSIWMYAIDTFLWPDS